MPPRITSTPSSSSGQQRTLLGFFSKTPSTGKSVKLPERTSPRKPVTKPSFDRQTTASSLTPAPSSDAPSPEPNTGKRDQASATPKGLPSPASTDNSQSNDINGVTSSGTPSRRVSVHSNTHKTQIADQSNSRQKPRISATLNLTVKVPTTMRSSNQEPGQEDLSRSDDAFQTVGTRKTMRKNLLKKVG